MIDGNLAKRLDEIGSFNELDFSLVNKKYLIRSSDMALK